MATSAKARKRTVVNAPVHAFLHETNAHTGEHRIVVLDRNTNVATKGEWARNNQIAVLNDLRACTDQYAGVFPEGIFVAKGLTTVVV